jgi:hypothetical protein
VSDRIVIDVDRDGWTKGLQLNIAHLDENGTGSGYRLAGPKYNGSSENLLRRELDERDVREIRAFLDAVFPAAPAEALYETPLFLAEFDSVEPELHLTLDAARAYCDDIAKAVADGQTWDWSRNEDGVYVQFWTHEDDDRALYLTGGTVTEVRVQDPATEDDRIVAYRDPNNSQVLHCRKHGAWRNFEPVTSEELPDGGICTFGRLSSLACGRDVLAEKGGTS